MPLTGDAQEQALALHPAQRETLAHGVGGGVVENGFVLDQAMSNVQASQQVEVALAEAF